MEKTKLKLTLLLLTVLFAIIGIILVIIGYSEGNLIYQVLGSIFFIIAIIAIIFWWRISRADDIVDRPTDVIRVVAIDDESDILRLIRIKLSKEGFEVITASDGEEGVRTVLQEKPDVMVVDVMMPGKDGYQVVSEVKSKLGETAPVTIMLTSKAEEADMVKGLSVGADDYITKPFSPRELIERINVAMIKVAKNKE
jgi:CheY-like chemotaxis protein